MNVSFLTYFDGQPRVICLSEDKPEQSLGYSRETEEGYEFASETYSLEEDKVVCQSQSGGRDCDGPITFYNEAHCTFDNLRKGYQDPDYPDLKYPKWEHESSGVHDAYAEAAGY